MRVSLSSTTRTTGSATLLETKELLALRSSRERIITQSAGPLIQTETVIRMDKTLKRTDKETWLSATMITLPLQLALEEGDVVDVDPTGGTGRVDPVGATGEVNRKELLVNLRQ